MYQMLLLLHIVAGTASLASGIFAMMARKSKGSHTLAGTWFYVAMYTVGATALIMSLLKWNPFLFSVGVFSLYLTWSGKQAIFYWRLTEQHKPKLAEKLPVLAAFIMAAIMILVPGWQMIAGAGRMSPVSMVFGSIMLFGTIRDFTVFRKHPYFAPRNKDWLLKHIGTMGGAYISAVTAFLVINVKGVPFWLPWLLPTVVGSALISFTIRKWTIKLTKHSRHEIGQTAVTD
ncbi:MAG: hypothetical protein EOP56_05705 [Sphingobacteriales bacterium]|nr:MAG: hypothetical protein EOP56_05705 [Sphingobacteriales bacterium]